MNVLWRACNLTSFTPCLTGPVDYPFASRHEGLGSIPSGVLMWNRDSPVSVVSLHWWPWRDWSLWPRLRWALSRTGTRPLFQQCDNPTWSHTALLPVSRSLQVLLLTSQPTYSAAGGSPVQSLQSHCINTMSHWSSGLPVCLPSWGNGFNPQGGTNVTPGFSC